jgi:hypothetical protein
MALRVFKSMRAVLESSRGAGGTPVRIIEFTAGTHDQKIDVIRPEEYRSSYFGHYASAVGTETNSFKIDGDLSYEMAAWLGKVYINGAATASGSTAVTWAFTPLGTADNLKSALVEFGYGDNIGANVPAWSVPYVVGDKLTIKWDKKASLVSFSADLLSPSVATQISAFTGSPSAPGVTLVSPSVTKVYIDPTTIGNTEDDYVIDAEWALDNKFANLYTLNGTNAAQLSARPQLLAWTLKLSRYYINDTELDARNAGTLRRVRVVSTGPVLGGGTYKLTNDFYGVYSSRTLAETDNLGIEQFTLEPQSPDGTSADYSMTVIESEATIT